jgi:Protein of unknown function DUF262/Protein of unknown function (DUF1524)
VGKRLATQSMTLPELLRSRDAFVLPASQRAYGWSEEQVDRLFSDAGVSSAHGSTRFNAPAWLFLGTIYLADLADGTTGIADGQQRIVTGMILYAAARDLAVETDANGPLAACIEAMVDGATGDPARATPRLRLRDADAAFFQRWVLDRDATLKPYQGERESSVGEAPAQALSESQTNILIIRTCIVEKLRALEPRGRQQLFDFLALASELAVITAPTLSDALNAYASTHKRGLQQAETDRLKFEIIGETPIAIRTSLANHWDECEARLGKDNLEDLCGLLLLNASGAMPPADLQTELLQQFNLPGEAAPFIERVLVPAAIAYVQILKSGEDLATFLRPGIIERPRVKRLRAHLVVLMRMTHMEWRAPALVALSTLKDDMVALEEVLSGLERLAAVFMLVGHETAATCQRYGALSSAIVTGDAAAIQKALTVEAGLRTRARNQITSANFGQKVRYRMPVLLKLSDVLAGETAMVNIKEVSCEHILPQNVGHDNPAWYQVFRSATGASYTGHFFRHRLGNLAVLTHADNRRAGAKPYPDKRPILGNSAFAISNHAAATAESWTADDIETRTKALSDLLIKAWRL